MMSGREANDAMEADYVEVNLTGGGVASISPRYRDATCSMEPYGFAAVHAVDRVAEGTGPEAGSSGNDQLESKGPEEGDEDARVVIKREARVFTNVKHGRRALRNIRLLRSLRHPAIERLCDVYQFPPRETDFTDLYTVCSRADTNLQQLIHSTHALSREQHQCIVAQLLCAVEHMHAFRIVHGHIHPQNILIDEDCAVQVTGFDRARTAGAASLQTDEDERRSAVPWYDAPELLLRVPCTPALDMWSVGCVYAEMCRRKVLFKGRDYVDQLDRIFNTLGAPADEDQDLAFLTKDCAREFVANNFPKFPESSIPTRLGERCRPRNIPWEKAKQLPVDTEGMALLAKLLTVNPDKRISAAQALGSQFVADFATEFQDLAREEGCMSLREASAQCKVDLDDINTANTQDHLRELAVAEIAELDTLLQKEKKTGDGSDNS